MGAYFQITKCLKHGCELKLSDSSKAITKASHFSKNNSKDLKINQIGINVIFDSCNLFASFYLEYFVCFAIQSIRLDYQNSPCV